MSQSPRPEPEADQVEQSPEDNEQPNQEENNMSRPEDDGPAGLYDFEVKEQDRWLPIANVARIMKGALPENAKIAKEAKECMQECVSEFISFITSEASEKCQQEKRKTVNGEDIIFAMTSLGFENYSEALKIYLSRYREANTDRSQGAPKSVSATGGAAVAASTEGQYDTGNPSLMSTGLGPADPTEQYPYGVGSGTGGEYQ